MTTILADDTNGAIHVDGANVLDWDGTHDNTGAGGYVYDPAVINLISSVVQNGGGAPFGRFTIYRAFFAFDTSGVLITPLTATITFYSRYDGVNESLGYILVKATAPDLVTDIVATDFSSLDGWKAGFNNTDLTAYSAKTTTAFVADVAPYGVNGFTITLNDAAKADMASSNILKVCLMDYKYDYLDDDPYGEGLSNGTIGFEASPRGAGAVFATACPKLDYVEGSPPPPVTPKGASATERIIIGITMMRGITYKKN